MRIRPTTNKRNREQALRDHQIEKAERKKKRRENPDESPETPQGDVSFPDVVLPLIAVKPVLDSVAAIGSIAAIVGPRVIAVPEVQVIATDAVADTQAVAPEVIAVVAETVVAVPEVVAVVETQAVAPEVIAVVAETVVAVPEALALASESIAGIPEVLAPEVLAPAVLAPDVLAGEPEGLVGVQDSAVPDVFAAAADAPASESDPKDALPAGAKRPVGRARSSSVRDGEAPRSTRPATDVAISAKPESAAARQSQTLLIAGVEAVSGAWVEELRHSLRRERRPISGGWPGTLSEARHRVAVCLLPWLQQRGGVVHYNQSPPTEVARQLNSAARRAWLMQSEADHEPWEAHAEGAADPSA